jgi:hypothetical protein
MSHELFYTSAPRGLRPGSRGFCTVASTQGLPAPLAEKIESVSAYRPLFPPLSPQAKLNPIVYSHLRLTVGGKTYSVLSRISPAELDYSQRSNKFAHHVILESGELPAGGPAWLLAQPGFVESQWDGEVRYIPSGRIPPQGDTAPSVCRHWRDLTGDAGWAGVLADAFEKDPSRQVYLVFDPGTDLLPLVVESLGLLPLSKRWLVTFSTYFTNLPQSIPCLWRFVANGSPEAASAKRIPGALVINLCEPLGKPSNSDLVEQARTGRRSMAPPTGPADDDGSKEWLKDFEPITQPRPLTANKNLQTYELLSTGQRQTTNPKAPALPRAEHRSAGEIAKPRRMSIWTALLGLMLGLGLGILASFAFSGFNWKQDLANERIASLEKRVQEAGLKIESDKLAIEKLSKDKRDAELREGEATKKIAKLEREKIAEEKAHLTTKSELNQLKADKKRVEKERNDLRKSLEKSTPRFADRPCFRLSERLSELAKNGEADEMPIKVWGLDPDKTRPRALLGAGHELKGKPDGKALTIENLGTFAIDKGNLKWAPSQGLDPEAKAHLRDCILEIQDTKDSRLIPLREPITKAKQEEFKFRLSQGNPHDLIQGSTSRPLRFERVAFLLGEKLFYWEASYGPKVEHPIMLVIPVELRDGMAGGILIKRSPQDSHLVSLEFKPIEGRSGRRPEINILTLIAHIEVEGTYVEVIKINRLGELMNKISAAF